MKLFLLYAFGLICVSSIGFFLYVRIKGFLVVKKQKRIKKRNAELKAYFKNFSEDEKLMIVDETPREVYIGERFYLLTPLKYRQYTRLCILFGKTLQDLKKNGVDYLNPDQFMSEGLQYAEDDFFRAVSIVLYFSKERDEKNEEKIFEGSQKEYAYLKNHATIDQITSVIEVVMKQNDIERALVAFGLVGGKKKVLAQAAS